MFRPSIPHRRPPALVIAAGIVAAVVSTAACRAPGDSDDGSDSVAAAAAPADEPRNEQSTATSWRRIGPPPAIPADRPLSAGFLVVNGVYNTELTAPYDILHHTRFHTSPGIEVFTVSPDGGPVTTFEGLRLSADHGFANAPPIDILVVPSAEGSMDRDLADAALIDWVKEVGGKAKFVMSLCDGAFVLAKAGLLDGRAVTTFPGDYDRFAALFPNLDLRVNVSFVRDGGVLTSQGGASSFDVAMHLVEHLYGERVAAGVGRGMVIPWPPAPGDQPAYVVEVHASDEP